MPVSRFYDSDSEGQSESGSDAFASSDSSSSEEASSSDSGKKHVSFGRSKKTFRETASLKVCNGDAEDSSPRGGKSTGTVWSRLRDTVLGATQNAKTTKPATNGSEAGKQTQAPAQMSMKSGILNGDQETAVSSTEWVARLQSTDVVRSRHKESCKNIAAVLEDFVPDQVWTLTGAERVKFNERIRNEVDSTLQSFGLCAYESVQSSHNELESAQKQKAELESKLLQMNRTYLKEITTNRDRTRDPMGTVQAAIEVTDQGSAIEFYEPLQYLSDDLREAVMTIVDEKVKQLFKCNPELAQYGNAVEMNKFETMMLTDKVDGLERMNTALREENREIRSKLRKAEKSLAKTEWELSEAKRHNQKTERELLRYQAAQAAEVTKAMTCLSGGADEQHDVTKGSRRPTRFSMANPHEVPTVTPICGTRRGTRFAMKDKEAMQKKRCSFAAVEVKSDPSSGDDVEGQEGKAVCGGCGAPHGPEALFCQKCGFKIGDCPPAAPSTSKITSQRRGSRFVAAFDDTLNFEDEDGQAKVLSPNSTQSQADATPGTGGLTGAFASVVANVMQKATGTAKAGTKRFSRAKTMPDQENEVPPSPRSVPNSRSNSRSASLAQSEVVFSDDDEQTPVKAARPKAKRQMRKAQTIGITQGQEKPFRKTASVTSIVSLASVASTVASAAALVSPEPEEDEEVEVSNSEQPSEQSQAREQEPEVTGSRREPQPSLSSTSRQRQASCSSVRSRGERQPIVSSVQSRGEQRQPSRQTATLESELQNPRIATLESELQKTESELQRTRQQLQVVMSELSSTRSQLAEAESRIENMDEMSKDADVTECKKCQRLAASLEQARQKHTQTKELLESEEELTSCLRSHLEKAGFAIAGADIARLEAIASLDDEDQLTKDFVQNLKSQLSSDGSLAEELEKIKTILGEDSPLCQADVSTDRRSVEVGPKPERKRSTERASRSSFDEPAAAQRKEALEESKLNQEIEQLVERNKLFQDKVAIKTAQLTSVCKENQVLKLALEDLQGEVNKLTNDLRNAMPSQEVAPPNLESVLERMEKVVVEGKVPVHMRLHQEAKLRDVAQTTKRMKAADTVSAENVASHRDKVVFSPDSTESVASFASASSFAPGVKPLREQVRSPVGSKSLPPKTLTPLSVNSSPKARNASTELEKGKIPPRETKQRQSTVSTNTLSLGGQALDVADEMAVQKAASVKNGAPRSGAAFGLRRSETLMNGEKTLPPVTGTGEQKGNLMLGCKGGMALLGSGAKKMTVR